jgi:hypothetical protein
MKQLTQNQADVLTVASASARSAVACLAHISDRSRQEQLLSELPNIADNFDDDTIFQDTAWKKYLVSIFEEGIRILKAE